MNEPVTLLLCADCDVFFDLQGAWEHQEAMAEEDDGMHGGFDLYQFTPTQATDIQGKTTLEVHYGL